MEIASMSVIRIILPSYLLFLSLAAWGQDDFVTTSGLRQPHQKIENPPTGTLTEHTQSESMRIPNGGGLDSALDCQVAYLNTTGVVISVTVFADAFRTTKIYTKPPTAPGLRLTGVSNSSTTAQAYVPPGGAYCPTGPGEFFVTVFRSGASPSDYSNAQATWADQIIGRTYFLEREGECWNYPVLRRTYFSQFFGQQPPLYFLVGYPRPPSTTNPVNSGC